jgi:hypothetical protein
VQTFVTTAEVETVLRVHGRRAIDLGDDRHAPQAPAMVADLARIVGTVHHVLQRGDSLGGEGG